MTSAPVRRGLNGFHICFLALFLTVSIYGWPQEQQISPAQQPKNPPQTVPPSAPEENPEKNKDTNPAQAVADKTKEVTIQAAQATKEVAQQGFEHLRDWEKGWITGVFVPKGHVMKPLTGEERREIFLTQTLTSPGAYFKRAFAAGIDQARGVPYQWDGGLRGYSERFASREGQFISANTLAALANAGLSYEPRYDRCQCSGFWPRTRHAIVRNFLTYNSTERELRPQLGLYGGSFGGGLISTAWKPHPRNAFAEGGRAMAGQAAYGTLLNFFIEFAGEINRKLGSRK